MGQLLIHQTFTDSSSGPALSCVAIEGGQDPPLLLRNSVQTGCSAFWEVDVCVCVSVCDGGDGALPPSRGEIKRAWPRQWYQGTNDGTVRSI